MVGVAQQLGAEPIAVDRPDDATALARALDAIIEEHRARLLVLDTFPEGLLDEQRYSSSTIRRVALLRCRKDAEGDRLRHGLERCDHAFDLEPHLQWRPASLPAEDFGPIVRPLCPTEPAVDVAILGTEPSLAGFVRRLATRLTRRGAAVAWTDAEGLHGLGERRPAHPLPASVLGAPVVVGPAGFNLSYEVQRLGGWHVALPQARPFDDQHRRARALAVLASSPQALERKILQLLRSRPAADRDPRVHEANALAERLLQR